MKPTELQLDRHGKLKLSEADVTKQCIDFLRAHGWRCIRLETMPVTGPGGGMTMIGEPGQPDWIVIRSKFCTDWLNRDLARLIFVEFKAPGKKLMRQQIAWHDQARSDGFEVLVIASLEALQEHMRWRMRL